jgi:hypothetical protein
LRFIQNWVVTIIQWMVHRWGALHWVASSLWPGGRLCSIKYTCKYLQRAKLGQAFIWYVRGFWPLTIV